MKKLLLGGHDEGADGEQDEGLAEALRHENKALKMEIFEMQDELVMLEKQVRDSDL